MVSGPDLLSTGRMGSNPGHRAAECNPGQVVYTRASVIKQYNLVTANARRLGE